MGVGGVVVTRDLDGMVRYDGVKGVEQLVVVGLQRFVRVSTTSDTLETRAVAYLVLEVLRRLMSSLSAFLKIKAKLVIGQ